MLHNETSAQAYHDDVKKLLTYRLLTSRTGEHLPYNFFQNVASKLVKDEDVPVLDLEYVPQLDPSRLAELDDSPLAIPLRRCNRRIAEFSTQYVQLVSSVLIHTKEVIVMLRLKRDNIHVDGYKINTLTVPEGHVSWDPPIFPADANMAHYHPRYIVETICMQNALRELGEEVRIRCDLSYEKIAPGLMVNGSIKDGWNQYIREKIRSAKLRSVFIPEAGSSIKHLLFCWDIFVDDPGWASMLDEDRFLESNEPEKHEVLYIYRDELHQYIYNYDLYAKELIAQCSDDWLWEFAKKGIKNV